MFAISYIDDGKFRLRMFSEEARSLPEEIEANEFDINSHFGLDDHTMPIDNFPDPFIACTFITNDLLYVNFFYAPDCINHSFLFNHVTRAVTSHIQI